MRIFTAAFIIWCLGAAVAQAGTEVRRVGGASHPTQSTIFVRPFCKFGLQFLAVINQENEHTSSEDNVSVLQVMAREGASGFPMKCQEDAAEPVVRYK